MKMLRTLKRVLTGAIAGMLLWSSAAAMPTVSGASVCTVNTNKTYQIIRGFGGMNLPEWMGSDMTSAQVQKAFGNGNDELGLSILRIYVSDDSSAWSRAVPTAKAAQKLGATVFATPWNPPSSIRQNGNNTNSGGKYQLRKDKWAEYAQHLNSYVKYMEGQGINLYSVSVQNEPDYAADWTYWSASDLASFIAQYGKAVTNGTNAKLMSPESFQYRKDIYNPILNNAQAMENCDLFGTHFYGTQRSQMDFPAIENSGKELWMTEVYVPNSSSSADSYPEAVQVAANIHNGLVVGNLNAYVWWYIRRSYSPLKEDGNISKRGYMMAQYSKYVRPGDFRIDCTEQPASNILISAYKHSDTQIEIVAVNSGSTEVSQQFAVDGRSITNVDRYRTTGTENIAATKNMDHETSSFWASLPANSASTFVVSLVSDGVALPENPNQPYVPEPDEPDENGYYFHDTFEGSTNSWEGRGSASINLGTNAYQGSGALAVSGREKAWNGALPGTKIDGPKAAAPAGDVNEDGSVNALDAEALVKFLLTENSQISAAADINGDNRINGRDLTLLKRLLLNPPAQTAEPVVTEPATTEPVTTQPVQLAYGQWDNRNTDVSWINGRKTVAISFDDGPVSNSTSASRIQDALTKQGFHATFFYWGNKINSGNQNEIVEAQKRGFEVANHTWTHPKLTEKDANTILSEYTQTKNKLDSILGVTKDYLVRPPYLAVNDTVKSTLPIPLINCGIDSGDWNKATTQQMIEKIQNAANNGSLNGQVVLMHETYDTTAAAVEQLCPWLDQHGYAIVTVSEMFKYNNKEMFRGNVYNNCN